MNPNFSAISLPYTAASSNSANFIVKIWCKPVYSKLPNSNTNTEWHLLSENRIDLKKLIYVGKSLHNTEDYFRTNSIILYLNEKAYVMPNSLRVAVAKIRSLSTTQRLNSTDRQNVSKSYDFDSLRSLNNLSNSLDELKHTKHKLSSLIDKHVESFYDETNVDNIKMVLGKLHNRNQVLEQSINKQKAINDSLSSDIYNTKIKINQIKELSSDKLNSVLDMGSNQLDFLESELEPIKESLENNVYPSLIEELQLTTKVIQEIIPIYNINNSVKFAIMGMEFPSSIKELLEVCYYNKKNLKNFNYSPTFDNEHDSHAFNIEQVNAGLSYIVQVITCLAHITNLHLKYEMVSDGNRNETKPIAYTLYYDHSKTEKVSGELSGSGRKYDLQNYDFEHGLNLLNKNLVQLINNVTDVYDEFKHDSRESKISNNIPNDCLDNFLWNLQFLILYITAPISQTEESI
ncbi:predicted protein [Scheffersomyces stipitis CBS 6054]|uniref:Uncharacterized protein n=1 Tax=Scheffersomyces stipitis (strain ATCC 58785 / CBS 6054 / NBRC 10063 / NRRL Y-11545) TaxID=322104 RepID=A3M065_PICST|nr:predicted protein [Scheffersomyces stipitis CBS 6054]ABN68662.2 predicted protein [Scheffersomyces stipitis CBS 6054]